MSSGREIKNAVIKSASLSFDHGLLTAMVTVVYGNGTNQGFGGVVLYCPPSSQHHHVMSRAGHFIGRCMQVAGVEAWDDIGGMAIRVDADDNKIHGIGHIIQDDWFYPVADFTIADGEAIEP